jgi:Fur family ferric uptake transcriptional regulator
LIYGRKPTDYLVNVDTDEVVEFHSPDLIELRDNICREHGLDPDGHQLIIYARKSDGK